MNTTLKTRTNGKGYWSSVESDVIIIRLGLTKHNELRAYFDPTEWNTNSAGLIYTDPLWIKTFRTALMIYGFTDAELAAIDYSEQGMQGDNYVSMDVKKAFLAHPIAQLIKEKTESFEAWEDLIVHIRHELKQYSEEVVLEYLTSSFKSHDKAKILAENLIRIAKESTK